MPSTDPATDPASGPGVRLAEQAISLATSVDRNGAVSDLVGLANDVDELEQARGLLVRRIQARSDDYEATAGLTLLNAAIAAAGPKAEVVWKPRKWRLPR